MAIPSTYRRVSHTALPIRDDILPVIVDQAMYVDGVRLSPGDLSDELATLRASASGFMWIGLKDPSDDEFALVNRELGLHPLAVEDAVTGNNDKTIGTILADALLKVGKDGVITVEEGRQIATEVDLVEGMQFERG